MPSSLCTSRMSFRICACTVTSSAVVGSSAMRSAGRQISAMAIIARWRKPAGKLERIGVDRLRRSRELDQPQHLDGALALLLLA